MLFMPALRLALLATALLTGSLANAQTTYKWIDPKTGTTVISDQHPPFGAKQVVKREANESNTAQQIPFATRQAAEKFPVTLYTASNCTDTCAQARDLLGNRGIPFSEKTLQKQEDILELANLLGSEPATPSIIVGRQTYKGFEPGAWNNLLDLAGYPKSAAYGTKPSGAIAK